MHEADRQSANWPAISALSGVFGLRMLGLFMLLPILSLWAEDLPGATPVLIGLALGAYGITQALFQIPLGALSDVWGRRRIIVGGLLVFAAGSVVAASAETIWGVIAGRGLQGAGAIAAATTALVADLTPPARRTRAMALFGVCIGGSFALSLVLAPPLESWIGVQGIFWLIAFLTLIGIGLLFALVPANGLLTQEAPPSWGTVARLPGLGGLMAGVLVLHLIMTATFVALPGVLRDAGGLPGPDHWQVYLPVLAAAALGMVPLILLAERGRRAGWALAVAVLLLALGQGALALLDQGLAGLALALWVFFTGFTFLEAHLPARLSRAVPAAARGRAMGLFSSAQFLGAFLGGLLGGAFWGWGGAMAVFLLCAVLGAAWLLALAARRIARTKPVDG